MTTLLTKLEFRQLKAQYNIKVLRFSKLYINYRIILSLHVDAMYNVQYNMYV